MGTMGVMTATHRWPRLRAAAWALALGALLAVSGCGGTPAPTATVYVDVTVPPGTVGATAPGATPTPTTKKPAKRVLDPVEVTVLTPEQIGGIYTFRTPSKRISCAIYGTSAGGLAPWAARCDLVAQAGWSVPGPAQGCEVGAWGGDEDGFRSVQLSGDPARPRVECVGDPAAAGTPRTMAYGTGVRIGRLQCESRTSGLRCVDPEGGAFELSLKRLVMSCKQGGNLKDVAIAPDPCSF